MEKKKNDQERDPWHKDPWLPAFLAETPAGRLLYAAAYSFRWNSAIQGVWFLLFTFLELLFYDVVLSDRLASITAGEDVTLGAALLVGCTVIGGAFLVRWLTLRLSMHIIKRKLDYRKKNIR
jgi:hypothetical protein